jgi:photosystem II stability/assembly factor-like uncharacterized protein/tetratricopeptide (TPR) repeat protein
MKICPAPVRKSLPRLLVLALAAGGLPSLDLGGSGSHSSATRALGMEPPLASPVTRGDARLHAIHFIDPDRGWGVGDRGVIWRTSDGGRSWEFQDSGVGCSLRDVYFVDGRHGWIVGGWTHPYTHHTSGVVLRTVDSGETWTRVPGDILPNLNRVRFFSSREGIALGASSALFPSGVFRTMDGGRSWNLVPVGQPRLTTTGDLLDMQSGAIAGPEGRLAVMAYGRSVPIQSPQLAGRDLRDLRLDDQNGWLVGDGGLVLRSSDGGATWKEPEGELPEGAREYFDFHAVATLDQHVWIAGAPGSVVFHSPDQGRTWQRMLTDHPLPIHGLTFLDHRRGWAAGELGTILATRDGGQTWRRQRAGGDRPALLGVFGEPESVPWELFSWYSANEGYLGALELLTRRERKNPTPLRAHVTRRTEEAMVAVGGSAAHTAWNFPLPISETGLSRRQILEHWDTVNQGEGQGKRRMLEYLVRKIRQWRPEIIITEDAEKGTQVGIGHEINQLVLTAFHQAADPQAFPDHSRLAGLEPWQPKKLYSRMSAPGLASYRLSNSQLATHLAASLDDFTAAGRGLVHSQYAPSDAQSEFRLLINTLPNNVNQGDLFAGLPISHGVGLRRPAHEVPPINLDALSRMTKQRRNIEQLLAHETSELASGAAWLGQIDELTRGFSPATSGMILYQLAKRYQRQGQLELAADAMQRLVELHPEHPLADSALLWMTHYYSSLEIAHRQSKENFQHQHVVQTDFQAPLSSGPFAERPAGLQREEESFLGSAPQAEGPATAATSASHIEQRARRALELSAVVSKIRPSLHAEPTIRFPIASVQRRLGNQRDPEHYYHHVTAIGLTPAWQSIAQGELWMRHASGNPARPTIDCRQAARRPRLDGKLDDAVWQDAPSVTLQDDPNSGSMGKARVQFAYDDEFLFVAARCQYAESGDYTRGDGPRTRDADLRDRDRLELLLDIDRNHATYYRLVVDHRGWTAEDCWGDSTWDPQWFVASDDDGEAWTVELAIPWTELTPTPPSSRTAWAVGIQRTAPRVGFQSWTRPATQEPLPEGFGLLLFQ